MKYYLVQTKETVNIAPIDLQNRGISKRKLDGWTFLMSCLEDVDYSIDQLNELFKKQRSVDISNMVDYYSSTGITFRGWNAINSYLHLSFARIQRDNYDITILGAAELSDINILNENLPKYHTSLKLPNIFVCYLWNNNIHRMENIYEIQKGVLSRRKSPTNSITWSNTSYRAIQLRFDPVPTGISHTTTLFNTVPAARAGYFG